MTKAAIEKADFKIIIGLGNPGLSYVKTRHNIGFRVLDALAEKYDVHWGKKDNYECAVVNISTKTILLVKPQTGMNNSGDVLSKLFKQGYSITDVLVVHDELEKKFGALQLRLGGSHRGHNGLRSIMGYGTDFWRLRFGIGRPSTSAEVPHYVLAPFSSKEEKEINSYIEKSIIIIEENI